MKRITSHHDGHGLNESIEINALDEIGPGGAPHIYEVTVPWMLVDGYALFDIHFQKGPRNQKGSPPGITDSTLLAIIADRLEGFQAGPFACRENALALTKIQEAMHWLRHRADGRAARGVLGKEEK